jgi:hypothetical protein
VSQTEGRKRKKGKAKTSHLEEGNAESGIAGTGRMITRAED